MLPTRNPSEILAVVRDVVYDYTNLVSSGTISVAGRQHHGDALTPPVNTHVGEAFLMGCRKMSDFFIPPANRHNDDVHAEHFLGSSLPFAFPNWNAWHQPMNRQLMHLSFARVTRPEPWSGHENKLFLDEFRAAWKLLLSKVPEPYRSEFDRQIELKETPPSEFTGLDLR